MAKAKDIKLTNEDELLISDSGDFVINESDTQHTKDIINSFAGWWKEFPTLGVGVFRFLNASGGYQRLVREIKIHLTADGYRVDSINIKNNEIYVTGERKNENI